MYSTLQVIGRCSSSYCLYVNQVNSGLGVLGTNMPSPFPLFVLTFILFSLVPHVMCYSNVSRGYYYFIVLNK